MRTWALITFLLLNFVALNFNNVYADDEIFVDGVQGTHVIPLDEGLDINFGPSFDFVGVGVEVKGDGQTTTVNIDGNAALDVQWAGSSICSGASCDTVNFSNDFSVTQSVLSTASVSLTDITIDTITMSGDVIDDFAQQTGMSNADSTNTDSDSGLEVIDNSLVLLRGCDDNQILKWDETNDDWNCEADSSGAFDSTAVDDTTWSDNANATNTWTFDVSGTDHTMIAGSAIVTFSNALTVDGALLAQTYGGITEANLVDKSVTEAITGDWDYGGGGIEIENNTALPGSCTVGQIFMDTNETAGQQLFGCESGSFVKQGDGGGVGDIERVGDCLSGECLVTGGNVTLDTVVMSGDTIDDFAQQTGMADADSSNTDSDSGLEVISNSLVLLRGCDDNQILKWDETNDDWNCEADSGGSAKFTWTMRPQQVKLPTTAPMGIDAGNDMWRGTMDDTVTDESGRWETILFPYDGGTLQGKIFYTLETTSSSDVAAFDLLIECKSDGDTGFDTDSFGTTNSIDSASQSLTADVLDVLTDTSLNEDSCAEFDHIVVKVFRDVSADGVTDDIFLSKVTIEEL